MQLFCYEWADWPTAGQAIVIANNRREARQLLRAHKEMLLKKLPHYCELSLDDVTRCVSKWMKSIYEVAEVKTMIASSTSLNRPRVIVYCHASV